MTTPVVKNEAGLVDDIAFATGLKKKDVIAVIGALKETVTEAIIRGEKVVLTDFVKIERKERAARNGYNPIKKETTVIPAQSVAKVTILTKFKRAVNGS